MSGTSDLSVTSEDLIWHYTTAARLQNILKTNSFWATSAAFMNNSEEMRTGRRAFRELIESRENVLSSEMVSLIMRTGLLDESGLTDNYLLSACASGDNLPMWRNYGGDGVSYSIGLDKRICFRFVL